MFLFTRTRSSFWIFRSFARQKFQISKQLSTLKNGNKSLILVDKTKHKQVCYFPFIRYHAALRKLKIIIPILSCLTIPVFYYFSENGINIIILSLFGGLFQYILASFLLKLSRNIVGIIHINKGDEVEEIIVSSLNENGRRIDRIHKPKDLVYCGYKTKISEALGFGTIIDSKSNIHYKINTKHLKIRDKKDFELVFKDSKIH